MPPTNKDGLFGFLETPDEIEIISDEVDGPEQVFFIKGIDHVTGKKVQEVIIVKGPGPVTSKYSYRHATIKPGDPRFPVEWEMGMGGGEADEI